MSENDSKESAEQQPDTPAIEHAVPVSTELLQYHQSLRPSQQQFGAPRRFGIGSILVVMAAASVLLAFLIAWGIPAAVVLHVVGFTTLIGFAQSILFKGSNPRLASIVAGLIICPVYMIGIVIFMVATQSMRRVDPESMACSTTSAFILGPLFGYLAGGLVGGIFLLMDRWEKRFGRQHETAQLFDPFAPEPIDSELIENDEELGAGDGGRKMGQ